MALSWWQGMKNAPKSRLRQQPPSKLRLLFESLEERTLLAAPVFHPLADPQILASNRDTLILSNIAVVNPGEAQATSAQAGHAGFFVDQQLGLFLDGRLNFNAFGGGEEWFRDAANAWHYLQPDGQLVRWDETPGTLSGTPIGAPLDLIYWYQPNLLYDAQPQDLAYAIDQALGLSTTGYLWENSGGAGERWLRGGFGEWYFIKPNGEFFRWDGGPQATGLRLAGFDPIYFEQPERLYEALPDRFTVTFADNRLTIDPASGFVGSFLVRALAEVGPDQSEKMFTVNVVDGRPSVTIADQTLGGSRTHAEVTARATDDDSDALNLSVVAGNAGYILDQTHDLRVGGGLAYNLFGGGEIWLFGGAGAWYFLQAGGPLTRWDSTPFLTGTPVSEPLEPVYWQRPELLYAGQPQDLAYALSQALGLFRAGDLFENLGGTGERWLLGDGGLNWYFIRPDGTFWLWDGSPQQATGTRLATFDPIYFSEPERLYAAQPGIANVSITAGRVSIDRAAGFVGNFQVRVRADDGVHTADDVFTVTCALGTSQVTNFSVDLAPTSDTAPAGDRTTASARVTLVGQTDPGVQVTLVGSGQTALASGTGAFQLPGVPLGTANGGVNALAFHVTGSDGAVGDFQQSFTFSGTQGATQDPVLRWNHNLLEAIRLDASAPTFATRAMAMASIAVGDAVSALDGTPTFYVSLTPPTDASAKAAVTGAAHRILSYLYPGQQAFFDRERDDALAELVDANVRLSNAGFVFGQAVADAVIAIRQHDGWDRFIIDEGSTEVGKWRPTAPMYAPALTPQWAELTPFAMTAPDQFRPAPPPALTSQAYADALSEVKALGSALGGQSSDPAVLERVRIARFWADGAGTYTPPGHWNLIAAAVAAGQGNSLSENARLFQQLNVALGDAAILCWNTKYADNLWRPITAIQEADSDGNDQTAADPTWLPLLVTPNFPAYASGHSTFSATAAAILTAFFGDQFAFDTTTLTPGITARHFDSFEAAAQEAGQSRIYGGIHFQFDNTGGQTSGQALASYVLGLFTRSADTQAPRVVVAAPPSGLVQPGNITVTGRVLDNLSGVAALEVKVDNGSFTPITLGATGNFSVPTTFALTGAEDGPHSLALRATDVAGNVSALELFTMTLDTQAPVISLTSPAPGSDLNSETRLAGVVQGTGSPITRLTYSFDGGAAVPLAFTPTTLDTSATTYGFDQPLDFTSLGLGDHTLTLTARDSAGLVSSSTVAVKVTTLAAFTVSGLAPMDGAIDVGVTYRPLLVFTRPVDPATLTAASFFATGPDGSTLPATIVPEDDGLSAMLFFTRPLPGAATITLTIDGTQVRSANGAVLDLTSLGAAGNKLSIAFTTVNLAPVPGTRLVGTLADPGPDLKPNSLDDVRAGPDQVLMTGDDIYRLPIEHVRVFIIGMEGQPGADTFTDAQGNFELTAIPAGNVKLVIDGTTAAHAPAGQYFPEMVMDLTLNAGRSTTVLGSMGTVEQQRANASVRGVYLPRLENAILHAAGGSAPTVITLDPVSAPNLSPEQTAGYSLTVAPNSLVGPDGQKLPNGQVGFSTVPPELVREMLPQGVMQLATTLTIQAPGVTAFSTPLQLSFANVYGAAPGSQLAVYSFNHTTGMLELTGTATVSADGKTVTTDPDSGIRNPGWFGITPPGGPGCPGGPPPAAPPRVNLLFGEGANSSGKPGRAVTPTIVAPQVHFITGDPLLLSPNLDVSLAWNAPPKTDEPPEPDRGAGRASGFNPPRPDPKTQKVLNVVVEVEGPLADFIRPVLDFLNPKAQPLDIRAKRHQFTLVGGSDTRVILYGKAKTYSEMFDFSNLTRDRLYGSKITVTETLTDGDTTTVTIKTYLIYRWIDVVDGALHASLSHPHNPPSSPSLTEDAVDRTAAFQRTQIGSTRQKFIDLFVDNLPTSFVRGDDANFTTSTLAPGGKFAAWTFHPKDDNTGTVLPDASAQIRKSKNVDIEVAVNVRGKQFKVNVGQLRAIGTASKPTKISVNTNGFTTALYTVIRNLQVEPNPIFTDNIFYDAGLDAEGKPQIYYVSADFEKDFADFLPDKLAGLSGADLLKKEGELLARVRLEAQNVLRVVQDAYKNIPGITVVDGPADVNLVWVDALASGALGHAFTDQDRAYLESYLGRSDVPLVEKMFALGEGINRQQESAVVPGEAGEFTIAPRLHYSRANFPGLTFAQFVSQVVSHELGHTFGLPDAYYNRTINGVSGGFPTIPYDIMASASDSPFDRNFRFDPRHEELLRFAIGSEGDNLLRWTTALDIFRRNFYHADTDTPLLSIDISPPAPQVLLGRDPQSFVSGDSDSFGAIVADTSGFTQHVYALTNVGSAPLTINSVSLAQGGTAFSLAGTSLAGTVVAPGASVDLIVRFEPTTVGAHQNQLIVTSNAEAFPTFVLALSGEAFALAPSARLVLVNNNLGGVDLGAAADLPAVATITNEGMQVLAISAIGLEAGASSFTLTGVPADLGTSPISLARGQSFTFGVRYKASRQGLERAKINVTTNDPAQALLRLGVVGTGLGEDLAADWGRDFVALELFEAQDAVVRTAVLRAVSDDDGNYAFFLSPAKRYHQAIFDPITGLIAHSHGLSAPSGDVTDLTATVVFEASTALDTDGDGLPDDVEFAVGTNPNKQFTAGDGIDDFTHVVVDRTDPLGGRAFPTGIIATLELEGEAERLTVTGSISEPGGQTAYVATGSHGLAIVDVTRFDTPVILSQLELLGESHDVAVDSRLMIAAVASDSYVHLVDVSNPREPAVLQSIVTQPPPFSPLTDRVEVFEGVAYVDVGPELRMYDLLSGHLLGKQPLANFDDVHDLKFADGRLYVLTDATLYVLEPNPYLPAVLGKIDVPGGVSPVETGRALFVGGGLAYVGYFGGYTVIDVANPAALKIISDPPTFPLAIHDLAANGSGLVLADSSFAGFHTFELSVFNSADPKNVSNRLTAFDLAGADPRLAIASGMTYVAHGNLGMKVINVLPFDTQGVAPTVSISLAAGTDSDPVRAGTQVASGSLLTVLADVRDDVQIRNVELLVDGRVVQNAVSFPFNLSAVVPTLTPGGPTTATLQVRAIDSGGNVGLSAPLTVELLADGSAPQVEFFNAAEGLVVFVKPLAAATVTTANFRLRDQAGQNIALGGVALRANRFVQLAMPVLAPGNYQLVIAGTAVTDRAGNPLSAGDIVLDFTTRALITLATSDFDSAVAGTQVMEGVLGNYTATVAAQEPLAGWRLLVNGKVTETDAEFQSTFQLQALAPGARTLTVQAAASDQNGNPVVSNVLTLDVRRPRVLSTFPTQDSVQGSFFNQIQVTFDGPVSDAGLVPENFQLRDSQDRLVAPTGEPTLFNGTFVTFRYGAVPDGEYRLLIKTSAMKDYADNNLDQPDLSIRFARAQISLTPLTGSRDPQTGHVRAIGGSLLSLQAANLESRPMTRAQLVVNGQVVQTLEQGLPFGGGTLNVALPEFAAATPTATVQLTGVDDQGKPLASNVLVVDILRDTTGPTIVSSDPQDGSEQFTTLTSAQVTFSEPLAAATVTTDNFLILDEAGNPVPVTVALDSDNVTVRLAFSPLATWRNQIVIKGSAVTDRFGNALGTSDVVIRFTVGDPITLSILGSVPFDPLTGNFRVVEGTSVNFEARARTTQSLPTSALIVNNVPVQSLNRDLTSGPAPFTWVVPNRDTTTTALVLVVGFGQNGDETARSIEYEFDILPDSVAPTIVSSDPAEGSTKPLNLAAAQIVFSEPLAAATVTSANFQLVDALNTPAAVTVSRAAGDTTVNLAFSPLQGGSYRLLIKSAQVTDRGGNPLGQTDVFLGFTVEGTAFQPTIQWGAGGGGDWSDPANWKDASGAPAGRVPSTNDDVLIGLTSSATITHAAGATSIRSLTSSATLLVSGGSLTISGELVLSGVLDGAGDVTVNGNMRWTGGKIAGSGRTSINNLTINSGQGVTLDGRTLDHSGTATWNAGDVALVNGAVFNNLATSTFIINAADAFTGVHGQAAVAFNNAGTVRVNSPVTGHAEFEVPFNNSGVVDVQTGEIILTAGTQSGAFQVAASGRLELIPMAGALTFTAAASVIGPGSFILFGDGVTFPGTFEVGSSFISGRISFTGQTRDLGLVQIGAAGQVDVSGDYALSSGGRFTTSINNVQAPAAVGLFNITGTAALAGTLRVFFNSQTAPALGTQFVVMNYGAHTGTFTSIEVNGLPPDLTLVPGYNAGNLVLTVSGTGLN